MINKQKLLPFTYIGIHIASVVAVGTVVRIQVEEGVLAILRRDGPGAGGTGQQGQDQHLLQAHPWHHSVLRLFVKLKVTL